MAATTDSRYGRDDAAARAVDALQQQSDHGQGPAYSQEHAVNANATRQPIANHDHGIGSGPQIVSTSNAVEVMCGPLLNYKRMSNEFTAQPMWHGSVLIVTTPGNNPGPLFLRICGPAGASTNGSSDTRRFQAQKLFEDPRKGFWRYEIDVPFGEQEAAWEYYIENMITAKDKQPMDATPKRFVVPAKHESMRIMFHSCNGFSVGTDMDVWTGPQLWNDVLRVHQQQPFHVMIGGGDQIYNDGVRVDGPLKPW